MLPIYRIAHLIKKAGTLAIESAKSRSHNEEALEIEVLDPKPFYTSGDIVTGQVTINFSKDITVKSIDVKLKGDVMTRTAHDARRHERREARISQTGIDPSCPSHDRIASTSRTVLYRETTTVFPTSELACAAAKSYTLASGRHSYAFTLQIPQSTKAGGPLPPSFSTYEGESYVNCEHTIKVVIRLASATSFNPWRAIPFLYVPPSRHQHSGVPRENLITASMDVGQNNHVIGEALVPLEGLPQGPQPIPLHLTVISTNPITIRHVYISLERSVQWFARDVKMQRYAARKTESIPIDGRAVNASGSHFDLTRYLSNVAINEYATPQFSESLVVVKYVLLIDVTFRDDSKSLESKTLKLRAPTTLLSPAPAKDVIEKAPDLVHTMLEIESTESFFGPPDYKQ